MRVTQRRYAFLAMLVAAISVAVGFVLLGRGGTAAGPTPWAKIYPDSAVNVCVRPMGGARVDLSAFEDSLSSLASKEIGKALDLARVDRVVTDDCGLEPPIDPLAGDTVQERRGYRSMTPEEAGKYDLVVYVYPQEIADRLGKAWDDRETPQGWILQKDTDDSWEIGFQAIFMGDQEVDDAVLRLRLVGDGLGLAGKSNPLRPFLDGRCIEPGNAECGAEILAQ